MTTQQEALAAALAYAFARTDLPAKTETGRDYADRLVPLMVESGYLAAIVPEDDFREPWQDRTGEPYPPYDPPAIVPEDTVVDDHAVIVKRWPHNEKPCYGQCHEAVQAAVGNFARLTRLDVPTLAQAVQAREKAAADADAPEPLTAEEIETTRRLVERYPEGYEGQRRWLATLDVGRRSGHTWADHIDCDPKDCTVAHLARAVPEPSGLREALLRIFDMTADRPDVRAVARAALSTERSDESDR